MTGGLFKNPFLFPCEKNFYFSSLQQIITASIGTGGSSDLWYCGWSAELEIKKALRHLGGFGTWKVLSSSKQLHHGVYGKSHRTC